MYYETAMTPTFAYHQWLDRACASELAERRLRQTPARTPTEMRSSSGSSCRSKNNIMHCITTTTNTTNTATTTTIS